MSRERGTAYFSDRGTDLIVDITGYFTGTPVASPLPVPANVRPPSRVLIVGDSTLAAVRFVTGSQGAMRGFDPVLDAEPCRRLVFPSCHSPTTNRVPNTAYEAITTTPGWVDAVVIMTGYNDWYDDFGYFLRTIVGAARAKGARQIVWLTYSEEGKSAEDHGAYVKNNVDLRAAAAVPGYEDVQVADWNAYIHHGDHWAGFDGIHLIESRCVRSRRLLLTLVRPPRGPAVHGAVGRRRTHRRPVPQPRHRPASPPTSAASTASDRSPRWRGVGSR